MLKRRGRPRLFSNESTTPAGIRLTLSEHDTLTKRYPRDSINVACRKQKAADCAFEHELGRLEVELEDELRVPCWTPLVPPSRVPNLPRLIAAALSATRFVRPDGRVISVEFDVRDACVLWTPHVFAKVDGVPDKLIPNPIESNGEHRRGFGNGSTVVFR
jgi:hypothetical protein